MKEVWKSLRTPSDQSMVIPDINSWSSYKENLKAYRDLNAPLIYPQVYSELLVNSPTRAFLPAHTVDIRVRVEADLKRKS